MAMAAVHEQVHQRTGEKDQVGQPADQAGEMHPVLKGQEQNREECETAEDPTGATACPDGSRMRCPVRGMVMGLHRILL